ncbi:MAG: FAD-dependent oxidoreductase [Actinomycetota bacterium]
MAEDSPVDVQVCILGAGPHGLAMALHLLRADPSLRDGMVVLDPAGEWLTTWDRQFARLEIDVLRSPSVHHPDPDVDALASFVSHQSMMSSGLPYDLPLTSSFRAFNRHAIERAELPQPMALQPRGVHLEQDGRLRLDCASSTITTDRLVIAANPHRRQIPDWVWPLCGQSSAQLAHASDIDLRALPDLTGERITIVGGGLTAAHLAIGATHRGAQVDIAARRPIVTRSFDTEPGWLGPKNLRGYERCEDPAERLAMARSARGGGTMPPWMRSRLDHEQIRLHEGVEITEAHGTDNGYRLTFATGEHRRADRVWLATGTTPDLGALRCIDPVRPDIATVEGLPIPDDDLRIGLPPVHVMGRLATLKLGPAAGNLWGARHAARRIAEAITGVDTTATPHLRDR